jgi:hypothetical protein
MAGDIEDFLRRAAKRRAAQSPPASRAPQPPPARLAPQAPQAIEYLGDDDVVDAYVVEQPGILSGHDVADHVSQHINTSAVGERLSHMGEEIDRADDRMEAHMHGYFEHKLGDLGAVTSRASDSTLDDDNVGQSDSDTEKLTPFNIRDLLGSPQSIRDAIILTEILGRPEDSW